MEGVARMYATGGWVGVGVGVDFSNKIEAFLTMPEI
jgi:hypothetical protein